MSKRAPSPYDIAVKANPESYGLPRHVYITVGSPGYDPAALAERYTLAEVVTGWRTVAGQISRLGLTLVDQVGLAKRRHRCEHLEPWLQCSVGGVGLLTYQEQIESGGGPSIDFTIPLESRKEYLDRVKTTLAQITGSDTATVTEEEELLWRPQAVLLRSVSR